MPHWSIGPIVGQYQPEDFTEKQSVNYEPAKAFGIVEPLIFKNWSPREVTLSFVVNAMSVPADEQALGPISAAPNQTDPEIVWATLCAMMRPGDLLLPPLLGGEDKRRDFPRVVIPGWNVGANTPNRAVVVDASIKRTHIAGEPSRAVRAVITVTLRELSSALERNRGFAKTERGGEGVKATGLQTFAAGEKPFFLPTATEEE